MTLHSGDTHSVAEFERLYRENYRRVYAFIRSRLLNKDAAEDLTSETFLNAARAFDRFDPSRASFSTWVLTIARNCTTSWIRKQYHELTMADLTDDIDPAAPADSYPSLEDDAVGMTEKLLALLDEQDRAIVYLKYYEQMQNAEIARVLDMNASTVGTRLQRALAKMRAAAERS